MSGPVKDPLRALQGARSRAQGGRLEEQIEASCALLTETGRADISKTPEPMKPVSQPNKSGQFRAVYTKKAEPDFKGVMLGGRAVMFEAKSTGTGRLNKDRVLPEQVKKLDSYTALGAHCFIVATFDGLRVYSLETNCGEPEGYGAARAVVHAEFSVLKQTDKGDVENERNYL